MSHVTVANQSQPDSTVISGSTGANGDEFGLGLAATDQYAVIGAPGNDDIGADRGTAYLFDRVADSWVENTIIYPTSLSTGFGYSVCIANDVCVIGNRNAANSEAIKAGVCEVHRRIGAAWVYETTLEETPAAGARSVSRFSQDMAISLDGDSLVVGAAYANTVQLGSGFAFVYKYNRGTGVWSQTKLNVAFTTTDRIGSAVAMAGDGSIAVVGAPWDSSVASKSGAAYVWDIEANTSQKLTSPIAAANGHFGGSVGVNSDGSLIAIAEPAVDAGQGCVHLYTHSAGILTHVKTFRNLRSLRFTTRIGNRTSGSTEPYSGSGQNRMDFVGRKLLVPGYLSNAASTSAGELWVLDLDDEFKSFGVFVGAGASDSAGASAVANGRLLLSTLNTAGKTATSGAVHEIPLPWSTITPAVLYFLMRGYRPGTADFETWTAVGAPNVANPSGLPIVDVTVVAKWTA